MLVRALTFRSLKGFPKTVQGASSYLRYTVEPLNNMMRRSVFAFGHIYFKAVLNASQKDPE